MTNSRTVITTSPCAQRCLSASSRRNQETDDETNPVAGQVLGDDLLVSTGVWSASKVAVRFGHQMRDIFADAYLRTGDDERLLSDRSRSLRAATNFLYCCVDCLTPCLSKMKLQCDGRLQTRTGEARPFLPPLSTCFVLILYDRRHLRHFYCFYCHRCRGVNEMRWASLRQQNTSMLASESTILLLSLGLVWPGMTFLPIILWIAPVSHDLL